MSANLELEIQKRLALNWLIQGAAQHAGLTFHHLIREELDALDPRFLPLYDRFALINLLQYWQLEVALLFGSPTRFWKGALSDQRHPFFGHPLLSRYGGMLAAESKQRGLARCKGKRLVPISFLFSIQTVITMERLRTLEKPHRRKLTQLAQETASKVWAIPSARLDAKLVQKVILPPHLPPARNPTGAMFRAGIVGLGGVERRGDELIVVARATNWQLLAKELVKGTADLICLHGLSPLDDQTCARILAATDHLDLEPWMLQSGGELWRRLLLVIPDNCPIARALMHLARLSSRELMSLLASVIEQRPDAAHRLATLLARN